MRRTVALLLACCFAPAAFAADTRPNVILFLVDDMGWMDSTPYGSKYYETPNIERLAARGLLFTDAYATPLCSPTRASILSGQYSSRHGVLTASGHQPPQPPGFQFLPDRAPSNRPIVTPISRNYLEPSQYTLAEALRDAGYRTGHIGKWHLGLTEPHWPEQQGFQFALHGHPDPGPRSYFSPYNYRQHQSFPNGPDGEYITDRFTDEAVKFIAENRERPFFLNLWHHGVHGPWGHKEEYTRALAAKKDPRGLQGNPIMASMLKSIDDSLGRVLDELDRRQLTSRTLFIFFSDNGGNVHSNTPEDRKQKKGDGGRKDSLITDWRKWAGDRPPTNNTPLRSGKGTLYEGGTRVPLIVMHPGAIAPGTRTASVVHAVDLYPTVLDWTGVPKNPQQVLDGISFAKVLRDPASTLPRDAVFNYFPMGGPGKPGGVWVRRGDWKLIRWFETGPEYPVLRELYNLREDVGETRNRAVDQPQIVRELDALIDEFLKSTKALAPKPNPDYQADSNTVTPRRPLGPQGGWTPKFSTLEVRDGALIVTGEGRNPFIAITGLNHDGPVTLRLRLKSDGGPLKVQWRTADQDKFPSTGQTAEITAPGGSDWAVVENALAVDGVLAHLRVYLPVRQAPATVDWIELRSANLTPQRWDFDTAE